VAAGRKLPLDQVRDVARGRVWSGADARAHGLVDELGGFWTAARLAARLGGVSQDNTRFKIYPRRNAPLSGLRAAVDGMEGAVDTLSQIRALLGLPGVREVVRQVEGAPRGGVQLLAPSLKQGPQN
jgi:protease-4